MTKAPSVGPAAGQRPTGSVRGWPDPQLIAAIRRDPPNLSAYDELADRYWNSLYGRCRLLTVDAKKASELAEEAWFHVLRERRALKSDDDFSSLLTTTAISLWQAVQPGRERAEQVANEDLAPFESTLPNDQVHNGHLSAATLPLDALSSAQELLAMRIDSALARLAPAHREVLVAHLIAGESCAEIAWRHKQSEQTVRDWLSQAIAAVVACDVQVSAAGRRRESVS